MRNTSPTSFLEYASSGKLSADETYTIELLIDKVRSDFDADYWENWSEQNDARESHQYEPSFLMEHVRPAAEALKALSWVSFQRLRTTERPVRDITAVRFLPNLSGFVLINNEVADITPLRDLTGLRRLDLARNPVRDISPLAGCHNLEHLNCAETPIEDFSVLQDLPRLRALSISIDQLPAFRRLEYLPSLRTLEFGLDTFDSFEGFPSMPEIRVIRSAHVQSLKGLELFPTLENLVNLSGEFSSLEPLRELKRLTHINVLSSRVRSLDPLTRLWALRDVWLSTEEGHLDLCPLAKLPALHEVTIKCGSREPSSLEKLRVELSSWDIEFASVWRRYTPSLELEVVDQETFDFYNIHEQFGLDDRDGNEQLLSSEREWLDGNLEQVLSADFGKDEDFTIPFQWSGGRSRTVVLLSQGAIEAFPRLVLGIQDVLSHANRDWIIYFQSEEDDFVVWVYPDKLRVTEKYAEKVRGLINGR